MGFCEFLTYLMTPNGVAAAYGVLLHFVVEWFPGFNDLAPRAKRLVFLLASLALPVLAATVGAAYGCQPWNFEATFWPAIVAGALAFGAGTVTHARSLNNGG